VTWRKGPAADAAFHAWTEGKTGRPLVDANMRELAKTGFMSNRGRQNGTRSFFSSLEVENGASKKEILSLSILFSFSC